ALVLAQRELEVARADLDRDRIVAVAVHHARDQAGGAGLARPALAHPFALLPVQGNHCHGRCLLLTGSLPDAFGPLRRAPRGIRRHGPIRRTASSASAPRGCAAPLPPAAPPPTARWCGAGAACDRG